MLERLRIQNFQCHERLQVDLDPAVTTIVGPTDSGKSAILRALRWVCLNQPAGDAFIRDGSKEATVQLLLATSDIVVRKRGELNTYWLNKAVYRAFGADVPRPVDDILRMASINFHRQLDAPFWLSETPGEVSRQLNDVVDLGLIDSTLKAVASAVRKCQTAVDVSRDRVADSWAAAEKLAWVPKAVAAYDVVNESGERHVVAAELTATVWRLVQESKEYDAKRRKATAAATAGQHAANVGRLVVATGEGRSELLVLILSIKRYQSTVDRQIPSLERVSAAVDNIADVRAKRERLECVMMEVDEAISRQERLKGVLAVWEDELATKTEGRCPICGSEYTETGGDA